MNKELIELVIIILVMGMIWILKKELEKSLTEDERQKIWRGEEEI